MIRIERAYFDNVASHTGIIIYLMDGIE